MTDMTEVVVTHLSDAVTLATYLRSVLVGTIEISWFQTSFFSLEGMRDIIFGLVDKLSIHSLFDVL